MSARKYAGYIMTEYPHELPKMEGGPDLNHLFDLNDSVIKGAFHVHCAWVSPGPNPGVYGAHTHPHDEVIGFIGTNPEDATDLGAEAELWMDDEKYIITRSFLAFIPRGLKHCPLTIRDVKRPIFHFDIQTAIGKPEFQWAED